MKLLTRYSAQIYWLLFALVTALAAFNAFYSLADGGVYDWDESRQGVNAYEMLRSGDYIVHTYEGEADYWNLKPPLSMWLVAASYKLFGYGLLGLRFPSALIMVVVTAVSMLFLGRRVGRVAAIATGLLFACSGTRFHHLFQTGDPDALFFLFCLLSCVFLYRAYAGATRSLVGTGLCVAGGFLTKATHVAPLFLVLLVSWLLLRKTRGFTLREVLLYLLLPMAAPVAGWALWRFARDGTAFFREMILFDIVGRVTTTVEEHAGGVSYYFQVLATLMGGWMTAGIVLAFVLVAMMAVTKTIEPRLDRTFLAIFGGMLLCPLLLFTLATTKLGWYAYPSLIGLFFLAGYAIQLLADGLRLKKQRAGAAVALALCGIPLAVGLAVEPFDDIRRMASTSSEGSVFDALEGEGDFSGRRYYTLNADGTEDQLSASWILHAYFLGLTRERGDYGAFQADPGGDVLLVVRGSPEALPDGDLLTKLAGSDTHTLLERSR